MVDLFQICLQESLPYSHFYCVSADGWQSYFCTIQISATVTKNYSNYIEGFCPCQELPAIQCEFHLFFPYYWLGAARLSFMRSCLKRDAMCLAASSGLCHVRQVLRDIVPTRKPGRSDYCRYSTRPLTDLKRWTIRAFNAWLRGCSL